MLKHGGRQIKNDKETKARSFLGRQLCRDEFSISNDVNIDTNIDELYQ